MNGTCFQAARRAFAQTAEMPGTALFFQIPQVILLQNQLMRSFTIAGDEDVEGHACISQHLSVEITEFEPSLIREFELTVHFLLHQRQHVTYDDIADLFQLDAGAEQFLSARDFKVAE